MKNQYRNRQTKPGVVPVKDLKMTHNERVDLLKDYVKSNLGYFADAISKDKKVKPPAWLHLKAKVKKKNWPPEMTDFILANFDLDMAVGHNPNDSGYDRLDGVDAVLLRNKATGETALSFAGTDWSEIKNGDPRELPGIIMNGNSRTHGKKHQKLLDDLKAQGKIPPEGITVVGDSKGGADADELSRNNPDIVKGVIKSSAPGTGGLPSIFDNDNDPRPGVTTIQTDGFSLISGYGDDSAEQKYLVTGENSHFSDEVLPQMKHNMQGIPAGNYADLESVEYYQNRLDNPRGRNRPGLVAQKQKAEDIARARKDYLAHQAQLRAEEGMPDPDAPETALPDYMRKTHRPPEEVRQGAKAIASKTVEKAAASGLIDKQLDGQVKKLQQGLNSLRPFWQNALENRPDKPNEPLASTHQPLAEDGDYGPKTESAVEGLVRQNGQEVADSLLDQTGAFALQDSDLPAANNNDMPSPLPRMGHLNIPSGFY